MSLRRYQDYSTSPFPHIGEMVKKVMVEKGISQAELARRMKVTSSSMAQYFGSSSIHFGVLWNLSLALEYDFLTEITNFYPANFPFNEKSNLIIDLQNKDHLIRDLEKEIKIYKSALGIKEG